LRGFAHHLAPLAVNTALAVKSTTMAVNNLLKFGSNVSNFQCGKTTIAKYYSEDHGHDFIYLDLDSIEDYRRIEDPVAPLYSS